MPKFSAVLLILCLVLPGEALSAAEQLTGTTAVNPMRCERPARHYLLLAETNFAAAAESTAFGFRTMAIAFATAAAHLYSICSQLEREGGEKPKNR